MNAFLRSAKRTLQEWIYPLGSTATVRRGPLRGCRYIVSEQSGWAPILGRWEPEAQRLYVELVRSGEVVWDLGANTGIHTLLFSRLAGESGKVVAFEPLPVNAEEIRSTCKLNSATNVNVVLKAISDTGGEAVFFMGRHDKQGSLVGIGSESGESLRVACLTLDDALDVLPNPDFLKIDIEGAESRALQGFGRVAEARYPSFAIDLHTPAEDAAVGSWLQANGYRAFRLIDEVARRQGARGAMVEEIGSLDRGWPARDGVWGTVIAVHPTRAVATKAVQRLTLNGRRSHASIAVTG